ncbi:MAG: hypothetical protein ACE5GX_20615 [Thermoanaerobaculia bacterium]
MTDVDRGWIRSLLQRWQGGDVDKRLVHEEAEAVWDGFKEWPNYPQEDPRSIPLEILSNLEALNHQLITPEDIPAILEFLDTPRGSELDGWKRWQRYWDELDMDERIESLKDDSYYSAYPIPRKSPEPHEVS